ncbi:MAG: autoinducer binding domain-containing protein [Lautropia sp.]|nr:autoinducer binding domain-containing protein [Lautropia sp.]
MAVWKPPDRDVDVGTLLADIEALASCEKEGVLHRVLRRVMAGMDIRQFLFCTFSVGAEGACSHHHFLVGCAPGWMQLYQQRHWYHNDPFLAHARAQARPALGSQLPCQSVGQQQMREMAARYGFRSCMVVPAHDSTHVFVGALLVANEDDPREGGEARLWRWQVLLRALSTILLEQRLSVHQRDLLQAWQLGARDLDMLALVSDGLAAHEVAARLSLSVSTVYAAYARLNEKLGVARIQESARLVRQYGLLSACQALGR